VACGLPILAFIMAINATMQLMATGGPLVQTVFTWAQFAEPPVRDRVLLRPADAVMTLIVTGVAR